MQVAQSVARRLVACILDGAPEDAAKIEIATHSQHVQQDASNDESEKRDTVISITKSG